MDPINDVPISPIEGTTAHARESRAQTLKGVAVVGTILLTSAGIGAMGTSAFQEMKRDRAASDLNTASMEARSKFGEIGQSSISFAYHASDLCELAGNIPLHGSKSFVSNFNASRKEFAAAAENFKVIYSNVGDDTPEQRADHAKALNALTATWTSFSRQLGEVVSFHGIENFRVNGAYPNDNNGYLTCVTAERIATELMPAVTNALSNFQSAEAVVMKLTGK